MLHAPSMRPLIEINGKQIRITGRLLRVARLEADGYQFVEDSPEPLLEDLKNSGHRVDLFSFLQKLPETKPRYSYHLEWDNFAALHLSTFDEWWNGQLGFKARNKAKQAEKKKVVVKEVPFDESLVKGIWEVYNETQVRQGVANTHYGKDLETVYREEATFLESSIFIAAYFEGELIGFAKLVHNESKTQAGLMNIVSMIRHRDKAPSNALIVQAVKSCVEREIPYLVYSKFAYGKKEKSTLSDFKERNGFHRIDVPRYYAPLTAFGRIALRFGLHKRFIDRLPAPLLVRLRGIRAAWYNRKSQPASEAS
jgi:hypothetical protein